MFKELNKAIKDNDLNTIKQIIQDNNIQNFTKKVLIEKIHFNNIFIYDKLDILKYFIDQFNIDINENKEQYIIMSASNDSINVLKYLEEKFNIDIHNISYKDMSLFVYSVGWGAFKVGDYFLETGANIKELYNNTRFYRIRKFLEKKSQIMANNSSKEKILKKQITSEELLSYVIVGNLSFIKYCIEKGYDPHLNDDEIFRFAAAHGHLHIIKYLIEDIGNINIHSHDEDAFRQAVYGECFDIVKYIWNLGNINIHIYDDNILKTAVKYEYYYMTKYILSLDNFSNETIIHCINNSDHYKITELLEEYLEQTIKKEF